MAFRIGIPVYKELQGNNIPIGGVWESIEDRQGNVTGFLGQKEPGLEVETLFVDMVAGERHIMLVTGRTVCDPLASVEVPWYVAQTVIHRLRLLQSTIKGRGPLLTFEYS